MHGINLETLVFFIFVFDNLLQEINRNFTIVNLANEKVFENSH